MSKSWKQPAKAKQVSRRNIDDLRVREKRVGRNNLKQEVKKMMNESWR